MPSTTEIRNLNLKDWNEKVLFLKTLWILQMETDWVWFETRLSLKFEKLKL